MQIPPSITMKGDFEKSLGSLESCSTASFLSRSSSLQDCQSLAADSDSHESIRPAEPSNDLAPLFRPPASLSASEQSSWSCDEKVITDEVIKAVVGAGTNQSWAIGGAGVYSLSIFRSSARTAHCRGTVKVISTISNKVLWELSDWRSDKDGVDSSFSIPIDEDCMVCLSMRAHHFSSACIRAGRSFVRVRIARTASLIKGRFQLRKSASIGSSLAVSFDANDLAHQEECQVRRSREDETSGKAVMRIRGMTVHHEVPNPWDDSHYGQTPAEWCCNALSRAIHKRSASESAA